jgi:hypothetical protein
VNRDRGKSPLRPRGAGHCGDRRWAALFDDARFQSAVGDFDCAKDLRGALAEPIASLKAWLKSAGPKTSALQSGGIAPPSSS